jgi:hypothetical protein
MHLSLMAKSKSNPNQNWNYHPKRIFISYSDVSCNGSPIHPVAKITHKNEPWQIGAYHGSLEIARRNSG